jgi:hypothetical protein
MIMAREGCAGGYAEYAVGSLTRSPRVVMRSLVISIESCQQKDLPIVQVFTGGRTKAVSTTKLVLLPRQKTI